MSLASLASAVTLAAVTVWLVACAAAPASSGVAAAPAVAPVVTPARWLLTWREPVPDDAAGLAAWEAEASAIAGVPVRQVAAVSGPVRAVTIACDGEAACAGTLARLRADPRVRDLVPDARRRTTSP